ncbi:MAG: Ger(x)C family spore germination protein [Clostridiaceae bacterium]|nr:Ger(x)C family spore germination protein [Clostridiaceae bacterium]
MKKMVILPVLILLIVNSVGCKAKFLPMSTEISDLRLVQVVGVDKSDDNPGYVSITAASKRMPYIGGEESSGDRGGGNESREGKALVLNAEGKTVFEAVRNIQTHGDKRIFWNHIKYYLISEEAARENISKYIDFFTRDHEFRIDAKIYIVKGSTTRELIEQVNKTEYFIVDKLDNLGRNMGLLSISEEMKIPALMRFIDIHHSSTRVPCIELVRRHNDDKRQLLDIDINGYAIFKDLKLVGFIERDISRGVNLITDNMESSIVVVKDFSGQDVSLEITQSNTEIIPHFIGDELVEVTIKTKVKSNLDEIHSQIDVTTEDSFRYMEKQQSEILKNEMEKSLNKVLELESDCLGIGDRIRLREPVKWKKIEDRWMDMWPDIKYNIQVDSLIERTYELKESSGYKRKE